MKQYTRVSACGLILDEDNRILLARLSKIVRGNAGKWTLPGGGIEFGEDPKKAIVREVKEETGLNATVGKLLDVDSDVFKFTDATAHGIRIIYEATVEPGDIVVESNGSTDAVQWFSRQEIKELITANEIELVSLAIKGLKLLGWPVE